jgi:hypothetical protein
MKKVYALILIAVILGGCTSFGGNPTLTDVEMSTRVAQILTDMPSSASLTPMPEQEGAESSTEDTAEPDLQIITSTPTLEIILPSATATPTQPTSTPTETFTPTALPSATATTTNTPLPTNTPPASDPRNRLGQPGSIDPMNDDTTWNWPVGVQDYTAIEFEDGYLALTGLKTTAGWRLPVAAASTDAYIEMTVRTGTCQGKDNYGIIFRIPVFQEADRGYLFAVSCDGHYRFTLWDGKAGENGAGVRMIDWRASEYIHTGSNQVNRIGVMTKADRFYLYINGYLLNKDTILTDDTYPGGHFGIFVTAAETTNFTMYVDEMSYWLQAYTP